MDDTNAFERQLADKVVQMAGPEPYFDAMEIAQAAASHSSRWRFQFMFSATRFVVAGAIVVLFGGFLVAGLYASPNTNELGPGASGAPSPTPTATLEQRSGKLQADLSGGFGVASPMWPGGVVEGSRGSFSHIDWYEPEGVIAREVYAMACSGRCKFEGEPWLPTRDDMQALTTDLYASETEAGRTAGVIYPMPEPPADIWWMVRLEFDPSEAGCETHVDTEGRCTVESGPWRWLTVPEGEPEVISVWGEDYTERGSGTTQLDWYEPEGVVARRVYYTTCKPDCEGTVPTKDEMRPYARNPALWANEDGFGQVGLLFRQPGPGPAEVWWMVELDFPPDHPRCEEATEPCTVTGGPWRYYLHPLLGFNEVEEMQPGVFRVLGSDEVRLDGDVVGVALSDAAAIQIEMADGRVLWLEDRVTTGLDPAVKTTSSAVVEMSLQGSVVATIDGRVLPEVQPMSLPDGTTLHAKRAVVEPSGYVWSVFENEAGASSLFAIRPGARDDGMPPAE